MELGKLSLTPLGDKQAQLLWKWTSSGFESASTWKPNALIMTPKVLSSRTWASLIIHLIVQGKIKQGKMKSLNSEQFLSNTAIIKFSANGRKDQKDCF